MAGVGKGEKVGLGLQGWREGGATKGSASPQGVWWVGGSCRAAQEEGGGAVSWGTSKGRPARLVLKRLAPESQHR